ncbi:di-heme-cytochrome C peroxidase [Azospirillum soli]|uniref:di-heme-cytochrome C peroxidase n=1 Tax=Azospirillum soli TaxID=1304799 RepID=UPI001AE7296E|nr:di-heme-cytochrome C peroxidase [Azospirillum soli]MBP2314441.1 hypothetical protein [Azospirillum soli]
MKARLLTTLAAGTMLLGACAEPPPAPPRPVSVNPPKQVGDLWYLDQNWNDDGARQWYYYATQGSQIMRYDWFMALEDPATKDLFHKGLTRFGYLPGTASSWNPDLLPVGFAKDVDPDKTAWIGMTCAACHTGDVRVGNKTMRIDGAVTTGDLYAFIGALSTAVRATATDDPTFERFAQRVLGSKATPANRLALLKQVRAFDASFADFVKDSTPDTPWGPMRTDAFGMIFNRVTSIDLKIPSNSRAPNAPVSYPHLWDAPYLPKVQWNGLLENATALDALGRNSGEVLGVFGKANLTKPKNDLHYYYTSTIRARNLYDMENQLRKLRSPVWPDSIAGTVDTIKAAAGEAIYQQNCAGCHQVVPRDEPMPKVSIRMEPLFTWADPNDPAKVKKAFGMMCTPGLGVDAAVKAGLVTVNYGSDPKMAVDALCKTAKTGPIEGVAMPPQFLGGKPLQPVEQDAVILSNAVIGTIIKSLLDDPGLAIDMAKGRESSQPWASQSASGQSASGQSWASGTTATKAVRPITDTRQVFNPKPGEKLSDEVLAIQAVLSQKKPAVDGSAPAVAASAVDKSKVDTLKARAPAKTAAAQAAEDDQALSQTIQTLMAYKARPLDGIWATAPYMHNGSVPNLYEMLLPAAQRSTTFRMGTTSLDPVKVGVDTSASDNTFTFDTTKPGNGNTGHEFGASLTDEQRWQLLEYLKTL